MSFFPLTEASKLRALPKSSIAVSYHCIPAHARPRLYHAFEYSGWSPIARVQSVVAAIRCPKAYFHIDQESNIGE
ncbi:hypothetical protein M758_UG119300 [Ceratodon purpureus]|nr:hypothetical protein M758_UG118300 [Ceratodon purpureus]KAG0594886.1 hypothetical protein M758_UG119300 [Ceratodon purpureus]